VSKTILLPIKPIYADQIMGGTKLCELRRVVPKDKIDYVVLYSSSPTKRVLGFMKVHYLLKGRVSTVWELTKKFSGIQRAAYRNYFLGAKEANAIIFREIYKLDTSLEITEIKKDLKVPQSFTYLENHVIEELKNKPHQKVYSCSSKLVFVSGIHGAGKSTFCDRLRFLPNIIIRTAGSIISEYKTLPSASKAIKDIPKNQDSLVEGVKNLFTQDKAILLDGHTCLINGKNEVERIPIETFQQLELKHITVIVDDPKVIKSRLLKRDGKDWSLNLIKRFQKEEIKYAKEISSLLNCNFNIIENSKVKEEDKFVVARQLLV